MLKIMVLYQKTAVEDAADTLIFWKLDAHQR